MACRYRPFYHDDSCTLSACRECGSVRLALGVVSLTLKAGQLEALSASLQAGLAHKEAIESAVDRRAAPKPPPPEQFH